MLQAHTEDQLVEQPAIGLFAELGWTTVSAMEESFGTTGRHGLIERPSFISRKSLLSSRFIFE